jgi:hypothetical protein
VASGVQEAPHPTGELRLGLLDLLPARHAGTVPQRGFGLGEAGRPLSTVSGKVHTMSLVVLLLILALLFGGVGLFVEGLTWLLIIGLVLLVVSLFTGYTSRTRTRV